MAKRRGLFSRLFDFRQSERELKQELAGYERQAKKEAKRRASADRKAKALLKQLERRKDCADELREWEHRKNMSKRERIDHYGTTRLPAKPKCGKSPLRRNPRGKRKTKRNPNADTQMLARARAMSEQFHGTPTEVLELSPAERRPLPRYVVLLGSVPDITYNPDRPSKRSKFSWKHECGDRGWLAPKAKACPKLVVDPVTKRPHLINDKSPVKLDPKAGLVG